ncbi:molybdate ABC transporter [Helicobacter sp. MIT 11-5569]|uniref:hypothetical protein n=1 Tax=Helicobacter sp. MIT 11-5569 TaxID=1548151 RepID=UPI00051F943B|nr:hypothetical protein [Helicobacter sp. MIT 11-5569]TLD84447.1 molybdate ABC transporter [Helicobacter sp. MIT 11-5569]
MNRFQAILTNFSAQDSILRLHLLCDSLESQMLSALLLEDSAFLEPFLGKTLEIGFKENNVVVGLELKGLHNVFKSEIAQIQTDTLFARLVLKATKEISNYTITALCPLDFITQNTLKIGDCIQWHIPENSVMLYL